MPLDGSFDYLISAMNRRNIARLSNGSHFRLLLIVQLGALLTSSAWGFFSSLKREVSFVQLALDALPISHTWGISFACLGIGAFLITHTWGVSARLYWPRGHPHHLNVRCSFIHLAMGGLLTSPAWGIISLIPHLFSVSKSTFVATCVVLTHQ